MVSAFGLGKRQGGNPALGKAGKSWSGVQGELERGGYKGTDLLLNTRITSFVFTSWAKIFGSVSNLNSSKTNCPFQGKLNTRILPLPTQRSYPYFSSQLVEKP